MKHVFLVLLFIFCSSVFADEVWQPVSGIKEADIKEVVIGKGVVYASSEKSLYRSDDNGETWSAVFSARGDGNIINFIATSGQGVFVCTGSGLFKSDDGKADWKRLFKGVGVEENNVLHIAFSEKGEIYLGTQGGLFVTSDNGVTWQKDQNLNTRWVTFLEEDIFLAAETGVYKKIDSGWKRVFVTQTEESEYDSDSTDSAASAIKPVNSIFIKEGDVFLATDTGMFISKDRGDSWNEFASNGLLSQKVKRILFRDNLFSVTERGLFVFLDKTKIWKALYKGMAASDTRSLSIDDKGIIWVATNKGLYTDMPSKSAPAFYNPDLDFGHEPTIRDVQEAAIKYAEVHPDKIQNWRARARLKPLLPELSVDYDKTINYDSGVDRYYTGPYDWGVSAKWDLGEIIWNHDQTTIDIRSKLMVQTIPSGVYGWSL